MFVSTFYSFKGGVGRTLALVNVAVELAKNGRRVLLVDFDLEAPGLDTFEKFAAPGPRLGVVDYVSDFIKNGQPPNVDAYAYEAPVSTDLQGDILVMPAGIRNSEYARKLAAIDWQSLYSDMDGFLLFEDLKDRWEEEFAPDYVLIDSRTGFTEVGGICTRQLPDLVVILFFPNEQNLKGVEHIVAAIRRENQELKGKEIDLLFVPSNVPTLDDEEDILKSMLDRFSKSLDLRKHKPFLQIQRYDSLHLLGQSVFCIDRPRSRLARQYKKLTREIVGHNLDDREAALAFLKRRGRRSDWPWWQSRSVHDDWTDFAKLSVREDDEKVPKLLRRHAKDFDVLVAAGVYYKEQAKSNEAISLLEQAAQFLPEEPARKRVSFFIELAESLIAEQRAEDAKKRLREALHESEVDAFALRRIIDLWKQVESHPIDDLPTYRWLSSFDEEEIEIVISSMDDSEPWMAVACDLMEPRIRRGDSDELLHPAILAAIGARRLKFTEHLCKIIETSQAKDLPNLFNVAMGQWATSGKCPTDEFKHAVELYEQLDMERDRPDANLEQCLALAYSICGEKEKAMNHLEQARLRNEILGSRKFSCWRYLQVSSEEFAKDLDMIEALIQGADTRPQFVSRHS